jgi:hypothetical protein
VKIQTTLEAVGSALLLFPYYLPLLSTSNILLYHHGLPVTNLIGGLLVDMLGVAILTLGFLVAIQYLPAVIQRILHALLASFMLWRIADITIGLLNNPDYPIFWWGYVRKQSCIVILLLSGILAYFLPRITQPAVRAVRLVVAAVAFSALWIVPQLLHLAFVRQLDKSAASNHPPTSTLRSSNRRIIWILFDELSYEQTFDHPASGIELPNFDRLRTESASFSNLKPAGFSTERIIPSLFLGRHIDQIRNTVDGDLWYKDESQNRWLAYDPNSTLFALAQRNGWSSGIDGWFNPYCHILASVLDVCSWEPNNFPILQTEAYGASEEKSILANAATLPNLFLAKLSNRKIAPANYHIQEYRNVVARTHALIKNEQVNFVFLHIPAPHPPGIYDRQHHMLRPGGTYLDNLVLADDTLGALLKEIDATPSASRTTVIVSSDHSWRIPLWKPAEDWSAEEERASGGLFDDRPVLLIHFPGQNSGNDVNSSQPELLEHDIIAGMLLGKLNNSDDLAAFLTQHDR